MPQLLERKGIRTEQPVRRTTAAPPRKQPKRRLWWAAAIGALLLVAGAVGWRTVAKLRSLGYAVELKPLRPEAIVA